MPGRGRPWKGVGEGVPDRIGTGAIADGSITEADLDSSVTSKLNSGSGYNTVEDEGTPLSQRSEINFVGTGVVASDDGEKTVVTIAGNTGHAIQDEGTPITQQTNMNFVGAGVTATAGGEDTTIVTIPSGGGHIIEDEGTPLASQPDLNFVGAGVTATNDGENTATVITIPGGGGSFSQEEVASPFDNHYLYDEFYYPTSTQLDNHYVKNGSFSVPSQKVSGQVSFTTPTTNNITHIRTCGGGLSAIEADKKFRFIVRAEMTSNTLHAQLINLFVDGGQLPAGSLPFTTNPTPHIQFLQNSGGNWFARTDNGVTPNSTDTGVTADTAMHTFEIVSDPSVPNIVFKIDDVIVATFTTNLPTGLMTMYIGNQNGEASSKTMNVDTMFLFNER